MKRAIAIIGVPWSTHELAPAVRDAAKLDARLSVVDTPDALARIDPALDVDKITVESLSARNAANALTSTRPDYIVSLTEMTLECAAEVREAFGQVGTSSETERNVIDKFLTRRILKARDLTRVGFWETTATDLCSLIAHLDLPVILKPRALTGSTGVRLIQTLDDVDDLESQYNLTVARRFGRDRLIVESVVEGDEISAEAMVVDGQLTLIMLTDKVTTGSPHFFEIGHIMPSRYSCGWSQRIQEYLQKCIEALNVMTSPIHAELKLSGSNLELIEIHTRFGGDDIVRLLEEVTGLRAFECYFRAVLEHRTPEPDSARCCWGVAFFTATIGHPSADIALSFPHPHSIMRIDLDRRRSPRLLEYEGVKLLYWRQGNVFFSSDCYADIYNNIAFMAERFGLVARSSVASDSL